MLQGNLKAKNNYLIDLDSIKGTKTELTYIPDPNYKRNLIDQKCVKTTLTKHFFFICFFVSLFFHFFFPFSIHKGTNFISKSFKLLHIKVDVESSKEDPATLTLVSLPAA